MKNSINATLATATLIALAMTLPVAAEPPSDTAHMDNTGLYEEEQQEQTVEDGSETLESEAVESEAVAPSIAEEDAPSDDFPDARAAEENNASAAQTSQPSVKKTFKNDLKHALLGLLLPAVERRVRKAMDSDDNASDPESEP